MIPQRRRGDPENDRRAHPISRAFVAAVVLAIGTVLQDWENPNSWGTAFGIIAAAVSGGVRRNGNH